MKCLCSWDTCDVTEAEVKYRLEEQQREYSENLLSGDGLKSEDEIREQVYNSDAIQLAWEDLVENLTSVLRERQKYDSRYWMCSVENFGWRSLDGYKLVKAEDGETLLREVLPNCDCTFKIYADGKNNLKIRNWHHDSPTGNEWYTLVPRKECECCSEPVESNHHKYCEWCKDQSTTTS
jgi:hypothetical protein